MAKSQDNRRRRKKAFKRMQAWKREQAWQAFCKVGEVASAFIRNQMMMRSFARQYFPLQDRILFTEAVDKEIDQMVLSLESK